MRKKSKTGIQKPADGRRNIGALIILITAVCVAVLAVHWPVLSAKVLSFDDDLFVGENSPLVQNPGWVLAKRALTEVFSPSLVTGYYQPLPVISIMADCAMGGSSGNLVPFHRTSLAIHIFNTALVVVLLYFLFGRPIPAAIGGLLFGVHPLSIEPVAWISDRKTLLAAFFSLWSLIFYVYSRTTHNARRTTVPLYVGSLVAYLFALMSKPTSIPIPVLMLALDYWPLNRLRSQDSRLQTRLTSLILEKIPFFILGIAFTIVTVISNNRSLGISLSSRIEGAIQLLHTFLTVCYLTIFYLRKVFWPMNLSSVYVLPEPLSLSNWVILAAVFGMFVLIAGLLFSLRQTRALLAGFLVFFLAILPVLGIVPFSNWVVASDKYVYLPSVGLLMILTSFLRWLCGTGGAGRALVRSITAAAVILVLACTETVATRRYLVYWRDSTSFFERMITITPNAPPLLNNLGNAYKVEGSFDKATVCYLRGLQIEPNDPELNYNFAVTLQAMGKIEQAVDYYRKAVQAEQTRAASYNNLGIILLSQGKLNQAADCFRQTLLLNPDRPSAMSNLAWILATHPDPKVCDVSQAVSLAERAAKLTHYEDIFVLNTLMLTYTVVDRPEDAVNVAQKAFALASAAGDREQASQIRRQIEVLKEQVAKKKRINP